MFLFQIMLIKLILLKNCVVINWYSNCDINREKDLLKQLKYKTMKNLFMILAFLLLATASFAQRANNQWSNENVKTISGTITDNQRPSGYLKATDGTDYIVHLGPVWFWNNNNYNLSLSDAIIKGNVKTIKGEYHLYPFTIDQNGSKIVIADDNGVPKWGNSKGNGKRNGKGYGWRNGRGNGNGYGRGNCWRNK